MEPSSIDTSVTAEDAPLIRMAIDLVATSATPACTVLAIAGDSYRMRRHRDAIAALRPALTGRPQPGEFP